jgi:hypothetical protein
MKPEALFRRIKQLEGQNDALIFHLAETNRLLYAIAHTSNTDLPGLAALARQVEANLTAVQSIAPQTKRG